MNPKEIENALHTDGFENDIICHYQPIVDRERNLSSFEVLARWYHASHGLIPAPDFISVAESSGRIISLGKWMLLEACRKCQKWNQGGGQSVAPGADRLSGRNVGVSVNVSAIQLAQGNFPEAVRRSLRVSGLHPSLLTLELTESVLVPDVDSAGRQLASLRDLGVRVALDDFGTGYSSLAYLASLPVDIIKLDRRFTQDVSARSRVVFHSVVDMAHKLDLRVVAEGVESEEEAATLLALGCDELQGRYFGAPQPFEEVSKLVVGPLASLLTE